MEVKLKFNTFNCLIFKFFMYLCNEILYLL